MKCDKYITLFEKWGENQLSETEKQELDLHIANCEICTQKYHNIHIYKKISLKLGKNKPLLKEKESLIDNIMAQLPDKETDVKNRRNDKLLLVPYKLRLVITSMAASLVLFFAVQQINDAVKIKNLESQYSLKRSSTNYSLLKAGLLVSYINSKPEIKWPSLIAGTKIILIKSTFANIKYNQHLLSNFKIQNTPGSGFNFSYDSTHHY